MLFRYGALLWSRRHDTYDGMLLDKDKMFCYLLLGRMLAVKPFIVKDCLV